MQNSLENIKTSIENLKAEINRHNALITEKMRRRSAMRSTTNW